MPQSEEELEAALAELEEGEVGAGDEAPGHNGAEEHAEEQRRAII